MLENFRPGTMATMGFGYEALKALKRGIILVSVSGFGQFGPYRDLPAFDPLGQAMSGLMDLTDRSARHSLWLIARPPCTRPSARSLPCATAIARAKVR